MSKSRAIYSDTQLFAASLFQLKVTVWERTADDIPVRVDDGGIIEKITPLYVKINGAYYERSDCEFRVDTSDVKS
ncbi:hypothetical protein [Paenibacillus agricola]|uniref:Uncharacterized protein n=1 Tax=Paenibacillus agricola TaxID=2716264 RepID=A0ABX0JDQ2_9BACL|nr:hypothetical protein [Paenibacillus agricola]NHN31830.1 hypothetical protein [Paenibacillus agricola]